MPLEKPKKPTELVPRAFGGIKNNFSDDLQSTGFEPNIPQTYNGDNLNYHLDATGKELDYVEKVVDFINQAPVNHAVFVNENNQLDYVNKNELGGGGLEIGDVAFTQMAIDESKGKRRKLNGQIIVQEQYQELTSILKASIAQNPDMACTEQEWQAEVAMSTAGICYKFVVDDVGGTIRLPKYPDYFIGGGNSSVVGNGTALGLTIDKINTFYMHSGQDWNGADPNNNSTPKWHSKDGQLPYSAETTYARFGSGNTSAIGITIDPTKSGIEAQLDSAELIKGTYFIQVATGAETKDEITNEHELINPYVLLESKFFENPVYNLSWLISNGSFTGSKAVHPHAYDALLIELNTDIEVGTTQNNYTKRGLPVKLATDSYTDYDFVVNSADETFRPPLKVNLASSKAVVGNGLTLGLTNGINNFGLQTTGSTSNLMGDAGSYGVALPSQTDGGGNDIPPVNKVGITTDPTKSGIETSDANLYLYFYVGETVQNANLINAGRIEEKLSSFLTRNNKEEITSWGMPDYSATIVPTSPFVAPCNGYLFALFGSGQNLTMTITQPDGKSHTFDKLGTYANDMSDIFYPIAKGCTVVSNFPNAKYFYPCIGG